MNLTKLDLGFGWTKARCGDLLFREPSIVGDEKPLFDQNKKTGYLICDNRFVGELALRHSDIKYYSLKDSKATTWTTDVLMKTALAYLKSGETNVVTGLPVDFYFSQKAEFEDLLNQVQNCRVHLEILGEGKYIETVTIREHKIVPQPLGAAMDYLLNNNGDLVRKEEARKQILIIDWGRYTLDLLILDGMEIHKVSCSPHGLGIDLAYKLLGRLLNEHIGSMPAPYEMDHVVKTNEYKGYNVKPLVDAAFKSAIQRIQFEIDSLNLTFHTHILAGGQAERLDQNLQLPNMVVGEQLSNLNGYGKIGRRTWPGI